MSDDWGFANDEWRVMNEGLRMTNDKWWMTNEGLRMTNDEWRMKNNIMKSEEWWMMSDEWGLLQRGMKARSEVWGRCEKIFLFKIDYRLQPRGRIVVDRGGVAVVQWRSGGVGSISVIYHWVICRSWPVVLGLLTGCVGTFDRLSWDFWPVILGLLTSCLGTSDRLRFLWMILNRALLLFFIGSWSL